MGKASKDKRDTYYRQAKEEGWRARSAFKLLQIDEEFRIFEGVNKVVDLCAAPGSWSQVLSKKLRHNESCTDVKIVAVDLQPMAPIPGVIQIQGDITELSTVNKILAEFKSELVELIVFDGAPDVTGIHDLDEFVQSQLLLAALNITTYLLKKGGTFIGKIFRGGDNSLLKSQLKLFFENVTITKPRSSRNSSTESFVVCRNFELPEGYQLNLINPLLHNTNFDWDNLEGINRFVVPFMCCGDLSAFDSDKGDMLKFKDISPVVSKPTDPPYAESKNLVTKVGEYVVEQLHVPHMHFQREVITYNELLTELEKEEMKEISDDGRLPSLFPPDYQHKIPKVKIKEEKIEIQSDDDFSLANLYDQFSDKCQI